LGLEIKYQGQVVSFYPGETVLDALERGGQTIPSSCRAGACQFCMLRVVEGDIPKKCQDGLKESLRNSGHFLSCICKPTTNLVCEPANSAPFRGYTSILEVSEIGPEVVLVRLARPEGFTFRPGQFVTVRREDGVARSYSIASSDCHRDAFDIHVRQIPGGQLSTWFHQEARPRDLLWLEGAKGDCSYYPGSPDEPLTLVGTGTGIAPLFAIVQDAVLQGHAGPIAIYHGSLSEDRFYFVDKLKELAATNLNVTYNRCVLKGPASEGVTVGALNEIVVQSLLNTDQRRVYLCGDPGLVRLLKKQVFLAGVSLTRVHSDPFIGTD